MKHLLIGSYVLLAGVFVAFLNWGQPSERIQGFTAPSMFNKARAVAHLHHIEALSGPGGRPVGSRANALVRQYVGEQLQKAGLEVVQQGFRDPMGGAIVNIIGQSPGTREEGILLSAHHDLDANAGPSADGAASLAVMLEVARASTEVRARDLPDQKRRALIFASWDGESFGCAGSTHFLDALSDKERRKLRAVVTLDALGGAGLPPVIHTLPYRDRFGSQSSVPDWLVLKLSQAARNRAASIPIGDPTLGLGYQILVRTIDVGYYSDDRPFLSQGIPAILISSFSLTRSSSNVRAARVDPEMIGSIGRSIEAAIMDLSSSETIPSGESDYLILQLPGRAAYRLTADQIKVLALLVLLPGSFALIRPSRYGRLRGTRTLFFASATIYVTGVLANPVLIGLLFGPVFLVAPLLSVPRKVALLTHLGALFLPLLFAAILIPLFLTGSSSLVTLSPIDLTTVGGLLTIAVIQLLVHGLRARRARRLRTAPTRLTPLYAGPTIPSE